MKLLLGWSQEVEPGHWERADVEMDENDLTQLLLDLKLPTNLSLSADIKFRLLKNEIERLVMDHRYTRGVVPREDALAALHTLAESRKELVIRIREAYDKRTHEHVHE